MTPTSDAATTTTIAGRSFAVHGRTGGLLALRIALQGGTAAELARDLASIDGVRVARGPGSLGRETCFIARCPGFKIVLSAGEVEGSLSVLVSRAPVDVDSGATSELSALLTRLMRDEPPPASDEPGRRTGTPSAQPQTSRLLAAGAAPLRRTALRPGKPLARKTPLTRKNPLGRGRIR